LPGPAPPPSAAAAFARAAAAALGFCCGFTLVPAPAAGRVAAADVPAAVAAPVATGERPFDFYGRGPYRADVPRPSAVLGYEAGRTHTTFRDQERVILAIAAAAKDRVRVIEYGHSVERRPLRLVIVSAPENLARLDAIRENNALLADPRRLAGPRGRAEEILRTQPVLTWISHAIHGDESASFETAMWTLYTLAASEAPEIVGALRNSVVLLNPVFNPDGHERFVVYNNSVAVGSPESFAFEQGEPWAVMGRSNHYRFDLNRDKLALSQPETRQETAVYLRWMPQVFVDQHGQPETYFFPPNSLPVGRQTDRARVEKWTDVFGRANGAAFDRYGWQYVTRETFDLFYPGYLDSWTTLSGAIGMTYETDGGGGLARRRGDETVSTLRDGIAHHFEAALTTIVTAARNREALLRDFLAFRRGAIEAGKTEKMRAVVIVPGADKGRAAELATLLLRAGVEVGEARGAFASAAAHAYLPPRGGKKAASRQTFPAGALVIDLAQPQGRLARAFLEPDADLEPAFVKEQIARRERNEKRNPNERQEGYDFYDVTAWALPYTFGVEAYWTEDAAPAAAADLRPLALGNDGSVALGTGGGAATVGVTGGARAGFAYLFPYDRDAAALLALKLLQEGYRLAVATKPLRAGGREWPRGTIVARVARNPETLHGRLDALARALGVAVTPVATGYSDTSPVGIGSGWVVNLRRPRIAVVADDGVSSTSFGAVWHLLERQAGGLDFTSLRLRHLRSPATLARFNVVILPEGGGYTAALGKPGIDALKEWMRRGNVLIGLGSGGTWFADKDAGISSVVAVGSDADKDAPAGAGANSEGKAATARQPGGGKSAAAPAPARAKKPLDVPGAIFRARLDPTHFLAYGYERDEIAVPLSGATFLRPSKEGANVVTFAAAGGGPLRLAGFTWPDNTEPLLARTAYVVDEPVGDGHALLFAADPTFRALWPGLRRLFLNGILFGPTAPAAGDVASGAAARR
jgi:hypothetical protein